MYLSPVYTAAPAVADERVGTVFAALDSLGIPYIRFEPDAPAPMAACAAVGNAQPAAGLWASSRCSVASFRAEEMI